MLVHGLGEHCGRYGGLVEKLVGLEFAVFGLDHPGHGQSGGARGHVHRFSDYLDTLRQYQQSVLAAHPGLPLFLFGHSMGGLISLHYLSHHGGGFAGGVLSAPPVTVPAHVPRAVVLLGRLMSVLLPRLPLIGMDPEGMSRDPDVVKAYLEDPLVFSGKFSARLGAELTTAIDQAPRVAERVRLPVLILQGDGDPIVDPEGAEKLENWLGSKDLTRLNYPGLYHELHNEPEKEQVLTDVADWLCRHCP